MLVDTRLLGEYQLVLLWKRLTSSSNNRGTAARMEKAPASRYTRVECQDLAELQRVCGDRIIADCW